jgi:hypothetical protein
MKAAETTPAKAKSMDIGLNHEVIESPAWLPGGMRPDATPPIVAARKNGVRIDATPNTPPNSEGRRSR